MKLGYRCMLGWPLERTVPRRKWLRALLGDLWAQEVMLLGVHWVKAERGHQARGHHGAASCFSCREKVRDSLGNREKPPGEGGLAGHIQGLDTWILCGSSVDPPWPCGPLSQAVRNRFRLTDLMELGCCRRRRQEQAFRMRLAVRSGRRDEWKGRGVWSSVRIECCGGPERVTESQGGPERVIESQGGPGRVREGQGGSERVTESGKGGGESQRVMKGCRVSQRIRELGSTVNENQLPKVKGSDRRGL